MPFPSHLRGGQIKLLPSGFPSGLPTVKRAASLKPNKGPKSMWLNFALFKQTMSMSGPGQRSTFQVREVALSIWERRPTRRRTAVESTAAIAVLMREAAVERGRWEGAEGAKIWLARSAVGGWVGLGLFVVVLRCWVFLGGLGKGIWFVGVCGFGAKISFARSVVMVSLCRAFDDLERLFAASRESDAAVGSQNWRVGMRATCGGGVLVDDAGTYSSVPLVRLTALGSDKFPQYAGEHMGFLILVRVLTVIDSFVSGYFSKSVFLALTTCFHMKAQTASVVLGDFPESALSLSVNAYNFVSGMKYVANWTGGLDSGS